MPKKRKRAKPKAGSRKYHVLRELPGHAYHEDRLTPEFEQFVESEVLPKLTLKGYKIPEKRRLTKHCIHNLVRLGVLNASVSDSRDWHKPGVKLRTEIWDLVIEAGFAVVCKGSESSRRQTLYRATNKLLDLRREWELKLVIDTTLGRNTELAEPTRFALVVLQTGKVDPATGEILPEELRKKPVPLQKAIERVAQRCADNLPDPRAVENGLDYFRGVEDTIDRINRSNLEHTWQAFVADEYTGKQRVFQPNPCLRQVHAGEFFRAVRLYSWGAWSGQNLSKEQRKTMRIDGERVAELDFSGHAPNLAYVSVGVMPPSGDVYQPERVFPQFYSFKNVSKAKQEIIRGFVKKATNIMLNVTKRKAANSSLGKLLSEHPERSFLTNVINDVEQTNAAGVVSRIVDAHPALADLFFTGAGIELMTLDGKIMKSILLEFVDAEKPVLAIHDSVVVKRSDAKFALRTMRAVYKRFTRREAVITRVF